MIRSIGLCKKRHTVMSENEVLSGVIVSVIAIVSGSVLYYPYKIISEIANVIDKFGSQNDMKLITINKILMAYGGGFVLFFGCYIVAVGLVTALLLECWQDYFVCFLSTGVLFGIVGLIIINCSLWTKDSSRCDTRSEKAELTDQEKKAKEATMRSDK